MAAGSCSNCLLLSLQLHLRRRQLRLLLSKMSHAALVLHLHACAAQTKPNEHQRCSA
jgi:hypothetical protein